MSEFEGSNDDVQDAVAAVGSLGLEVDLGDQAPEPEVDEQQQQEQEAQEREARDRQAREAWSMRQERRNQELEAARQENLILRQQAQQMQAFLAQQQQRPAPAPGQTMSQEEFDSLPEDFKRYMQAQLQQTFEHYNKRQQEALAPLLRRIQIEDQQRQVELQHRQQKQQFDQYSNRIIQDVRQYGDANPVFREQWHTFETAMAGALKRCGLNDAQVGSFLTANAFGMAETAYQFGLNPGYFSHMLVDEILRSAGGRQARQRQVSQQDQLNQNAARLSRPAPASRANRGGDIDLENFTRNDVAKISKQVGRARLGSVLSRLAAQAEEL